MVFWGSRAKECPAMSVPMANNQYRMGWKAQRMIVNAGRLPFVGL
jgi:hypothetical protein